MARHSVREEGKYYLIERHRSDLEFRKAHGPFKGEDLSREEEKIIKKVEGESPELVGKVYFDTKGTKAPLLTPAGKSSNGKRRIKGRA
jgi:hypothetical protein